jgi:hypothetical protein
MNRLLACTLLVVAFVPSAAAAPARGPSTSTPTLPPSLTVIGTPPSGQNAMEFIGSGRDSGSGIMPFGYFTHIDGLPDDLLFSDPSIRTEATARFTFSGAPGTGSRTMLGTLVASSGTANVTFFFNPTPSGNFNDPSSFTRGQPVASYAVRTRSILHVLVPISAAGPGKALVNAVGDVIQTQADPFTLQGRPFVFGKVGLRLRLTAEGDAIVAQANPPLATAVLAGALLTVAP